MGNVPISCCKSKSAKDNSNDANSKSSSHSTSNSNRRNSRKQHKSQHNNNRLDNNNDEQETIPAAHILQHISEREPDDSETDPSSNPVDRPIFAARSCCRLRSATTVSNHSNNHSEIYSNNSTFAQGQQQQKRGRTDSNALLNYSQDQGYRSKDSTSPDDLLSGDTSNLVESFTKTTMNDLNNAFIIDGNNLGCCETRQNKDIYSGHTHEITCSLNDIDHNGATLQHSDDLISNDHIHDFSNHDPSYRPSKDIAGFENLRVFPIDGQYRLWKSSSCSTIYCNGSTICQPNLKDTIKCVSLAIYFHIRNRSSENDVEIFDETLHPLRFPKDCDQNKSKQDNDDGNDQKNNEKKFQLSDSSDDDDDDDDDESEDQMYNQEYDNGFQSHDDHRVGADHDSNISNEKHKRHMTRNYGQANGHLKSMGDPNERTIYRFVKRLFKAAELSSEYAITTLVYLERLMTYAEMDLTPKTWRRMFLGAIVLSSKVWEDLAVWNVDYAQILEDISVEDINELERHFLGLIQFNMNVPSSVYAKYYFHLRTLALTNGIKTEQNLMTIKEAKTLEAFSGNHFEAWDQSPIQRKAKPDLKRHKSLDTVIENGFSRAVLM